MFFFVLNDYKVGLEGWSRERERAFCRTTPITSPLKRQNKRLIIVWRGAPLKAQVPPSAPKKEHSIGCSFFIDFLLIRSATNKKVGLGFLLRIDTPTRACYNNFEFIWSVVHVNTLLDNLKNPPNAYRTAPLWVWNDEMDKTEIERQLNELATHGFGGAFVHPRPGLVTPYLSDEWFDLWGHALQVAKKLGLYLYIYDENSYPSGFGGGHVSVKHEDKLSTFMRYAVVDSTDEIPEETLTVYGADKDLKNAVRLDDLPKSEWANFGEKFIVLTFQDATRTGWMAGFGYVDLLRPEVTQTFLECTHEAYYRRFGEEFGKTIPAVFTDEPSVGMYGGGSMPYSEWLLTEFENRKGYSLKKHLPLVYEDLEGDCFDYPAKKVRFDYFDTIARLWTDNSIKPIGGWCKRHGVRYTGHYMEHLWPLLNDATSPAVQSNYEFHDWPGVDMLLSSYLRNEPTHAITHTLREVSSAANQFGKERVLCELYGAGGWDSTFDDYKRMVDWVMVNGVNFINQHLTYSTITGARKHDHPQSFDWREPWWDEYKTLNDYFARACYLLSQGKAQKKILVLNPTLTGYITPPNQSDGDLFRRSGVDSVKNPDMSGFLSLCQTLTDYGWEYDLGDEYTLARHAKCVKNGLQIGEQIYEVVLVSGDMKVMLSSTATLLKNCLTNGVKVAGVNASNCLIDGLENDDAKKLFDNADKTDISKVNAYLGGFLTRSVVSSTPFLSGVTYLKRVLSSGEKLYFFTNQAMERFETNLSFLGKSVRQISLFDGEVFPVPFTINGENVCTSLALNRNQSAMFFVSDKPTKSAAPSPNVKTKTVELSPIKIVAESENVYPIIYADYRLEKSIYVKRLCDKIFTERGFDGNPWDNKVQFNRALLDKNQFDDRSGFQVDYRFSLDNGFTPKTLFVVVEKPLLCRVEINGNPARWTGETWLDRHFGVVDATALVQQGENVVSVIADKFDVRLEVDAVYLKGDFSVQKRGEKWILSTPTTLTIGSWKTQGYPFYPFAVEYNYSVRLGKKPKLARFHLPNVNASAVSLTVNGNNAGLLHADGNGAKEIEQWLQTGENVVRVRVCGSHKNFLGPHFDKSRGSAWPAMWKSSPLHEPSADEYDLHDYGVFGAAILEIDE